ncbi:MAG: glycosyltransferase [archaeon]
MKILLTTSFYPPYHIGGACTHVKYLAECLVQEGHDVHVLTSLDSYYFKRERVVKIVEDNGVKIHWMKSPLDIFEPILNYSFQTMPHTYNYFKKLIKKENFDIVHHHNISLLGPKILKKIGDYKNIYTAHDYWLICPKYDLLKNGKVCLSRKNCILCCLKHKKPFPLMDINKYIKDLDYIISPSEYLAEKLKTLGKVKNNIKVINNFVPNYSKNLNSSGYKDYFLFVGQLETLKGIIPLISLFKKIDKKIVVAGVGSLEKEIISISKKYKNIIYLGFLDKNNIYGLMKNANALILPSQWPENNSMVIIESYMLDTPAIASNLGGNPELIEMLDKDLCFQWNDFNQLKKIIMNFDKKKYKNIPKLDFQKYYKKYKVLIK